MTEPQSSWERKLKELEERLERETSLQESPRLSSLLQSWLYQMKQWFVMLPNWGKASVAIAGMFLGWRLLVLVINVTSALLSMVFLGGVLYIGYRFLIAPTSDKDAGQ